METFRQKIYGKFGGCCAYCGVPLDDNWQVDHIHPRHRGGTDDEENLAPACRSCNATKATYTVEEFRQRLIDDVQRLRRDSAKFRILERFKLVSQRDLNVVFWFEQTSRH